ncbi:DUF1566 domain-containing protein [Alicycliphilus denitrificans]|uniref:DUF1566 domain-containing protein n=1 Tax=Alicycliphilus denitrificans TaxID=179636 RepID=UPI000C9FFB2E|nr:DUF1566 domain-containing protein [Alicycliphilus denitrificans]
MHITLNNPTFNFQAPPADFFAVLLRGKEPDTTAPAVTKAVSGRPQIGEYWAGQGGIYAGDFRAGDGLTYGLIAAPDQDIGRATWGPNGKRDLSGWDGLENTRSLIKESPAAKLAAGYTRDGHSDFYLPAHRELLLGAANLYETFGTESWYWTSTPYANDYAKAFDFETGHCLYYSRDHEFRVRPFRRFIY